MQWLAVVLLGAVVSCSGTRGRDDTAAHSLKDEPLKDGVTLSIRDVSGYTAGYVDEPIFGGRIYLVQAGPNDGPPVLLIHGLGENGVRDWYGVIPRLAESYRVTAFDLPGFARSTKTNTKYSPGRYVELIKWVVDQNIKETFDLIGHSLGGALSLLYAGTYPETVRQLVLADVAGILDRHVFVGYMMDEHTGFLSTMRPKKTFGWSLPLLLGLTNIFDFEPHRFLESPQARKEKLGGDPRKIAGLALMLQDFGPAISSVRCPTLLIWGEEDRIAPLRTAFALHDRLENATLEILPGTAHTPMHDLPDLFSMKIMRFLESPQAEIASKTEEKALFVTDRKERIEGQSDTVIQGDFDVLEIVSCKNITIRDARIRKLVAISSSIEITSSDIMGTEFGIDVISSKVKVTGGTISGDTAIRTTSSLLDLAGVNLKAEGDTLQCLGDSKVVFSVCPLEKGDSKISHLHGYYSLQSGKII